MAYVTYLHKVSQQSLKIYQFNIKSYLYSMKTDDKYICYLSISVSSPLPSLHLLGCINNKPFKGKRIIIQKL